MNDLDKIAAEAGKDIWSNRPHWTKDDIAMIEHFIKSAIEKAYPELADAVAKMTIELVKSRAAHASEPDASEPMTFRTTNIRCDNCGKSVSDHERGIYCPIRAAHRVEKDAAGATDDNCRKCGRPLGWFEPGLCDNCRAARASNAKPLERCSSNPHYEAHFGDEPAHASEKP